MATNKNFVVKNGLEVGGDIVVTGSLQTSGLTLPTSDGTSGQVIATDGNGNLSFQTIVSNFTISDGTNTDTFNTGETLTFTAGTGITTTVSNNVVTISGATQYTDADAISAVEGAAHLTIDGGTLYVDTSNNYVGIGDTSPQHKLDVAGGIGINGTEVIDTSGEIVTAQLKNSGATAGSYGSASLVPVITVDAKGRITSASTTSVAGVSSFSYNSASEVLTINTADGGSFTADISGLASESYVSTALANLVDSAPGTLDTLNELAAALGDDPNFATTVATTINDKVSKSGDTISGALSVNGNLTIDANTLFVDAANNRVGIGTNLPVSILSIDGTNSGSPNNTLAGSWLNVGSSLSSGFGMRQKSTDVGISGSGYPFQMAVTGGLPFEIYTADGMPLVFGTSATERARITSAGDLLVGTTNSDVGGSVTGIRLRSNGAILNSIDGTNFYDTTIYADRRGTNNTGSILSLALGGYWKSSIGVIGTNNVTNDGGITFNTIYNNDTLVEQMRITPSSVGIGTTNPSGKFVVNNNTNYPYTRLTFSDSTAEAKLSITNNIGPGFGPGYKASLNFQTDVGPNGSYAPSDKWGIRQYDYYIGRWATRLDFYNYGNLNTATVSMTDTGWVGIGTTNPMYLLHSVGGHVVTNIGSSAPTDGAGDSRTAGFGFKVATSDSQVLGALINATAAPNWGADINFNVRNSGGGTFPATPAMVIKSTSGNVGIGTSSPNANLHTQGSSTNIVSMQVQNTEGTGSRLDMYAFGSSPAVQSAHRAAVYQWTGAGIDLWTRTGDLHFGTNNTERMRIDSSGNVGMGGRVVYDGDSSGAVKHFSMPSTTSRLSWGTPGSDNYRLNVSGGGALLFGVDGDSEYFAIETHQSGHSHNEKFRVDTLGRVTTPYQPRFIGTNNSDHNSNYFTWITHPSGTNGGAGYGLLKWPDTFYANGITRSNDNTRFTAPVAGTYHFECTIDILNGSGILFRLLKNGARYQDEERIANISNNGWWNYNYSGYVYLNQNDYVESSLSNGSWSNLAGGVWSKFSLVLVG